MVLLYLFRELQSGCEHQRAHGPSSFARFFGLALDLRGLRRKRGRAERFEHRDEEGGRLAAAGRSAGENLAPLFDVQLKLGSY